MHVAALYIFPVKSMAGIALREAAVDPWGLRNDRRWMVVSPEGCFLTQRELPRMALMRATLLPDGLCLTAEGLGSIEAAPTGGSLTVTVWNDTVAAACCSPAVDAFVTAALGVACRLVYLDDPARRKIPEQWRVADESVSFADGFPVLLTSLGSLDDLNARLAQPIRINLFRGNIVVAGAAAWAEDFWARIRIGGIVFRIAKPCERCVITTIEQETAQRPDRSEPLRTLGVFRRSGQGVTFGQNLIPEAPGVLRVGDDVQASSA